MDLTMESLETQVSFLLKIIDTFEVIHVSQMYWTTFSGDLSLSFGRSIVGRRFLFIVGTLYLYRCITMYITTLPVPGMHFKCSAKVQIILKLIQEK